MGTYHRAVWEPDPAGTTRAQRRGGTYRYYVPTPLADLDLSIGSDVAGDVTRAEVAIRELNSRAKALASTEGVARLLLRAEAVSSSYIEGLQLGARRLLRAEFAMGRERESATDRVAVEIIGNINAMQDALAVASSEESVTVETILELHRRLAEGTPLERWGGVVRESQNWVGGSGFSPLTAVYVPPAPEYVGPGLEDLAWYCNQAIDPAVLQAAIVHAQFVTIHPFADGNGRCGRALIHLILRRRGVAPRLIPPISLVLARNTKGYIAGLTSYRSVDDSDRENMKGINEWLSYFAGVCLEACSAAEEYESESATLIAEWRSALGTLREGSAALLLLDELIGRPVFDVVSMVEATGRSRKAVSDAVDRLLAAGIVSQTAAQRRNRVFEVPQVIDRLADLERRLHLA